MPTIAIGTMQWLRMATRYVRSEPSSVRPNDQCDRTLALQVHRGAMTLSPVMISPSKARLRSYYSGRHALITGGSTGIGAAVARQLVEAGAGVTLVARRARPLGQLAAELQRKRPDVEVRQLQLDVADQQAVAEVLPSELAACPVDLLVNNAGVAHVGTFLGTDTERFRALMETNLFGAISMCRAVLPQMLEGGGGDVVNVGSVLGLEGVYGYSAYSASKFALGGFTQVLRAELCHHGVRVFLVLPPNTDTAQLADEIAMLPPELLRLHTTSKVHSSESVAASLLHGVARGRFEIVPGFDTRMLVRTHRLLRSPLRAYFDWLVRRGLSANAR